MLPYNDSRLTKIALVLFFLLIIGYAFYESYGLVSGPSISIASAPITAHDPFIRLQGTADRISGLAMNGKDISVTEAGAFDEPYLLAPGRNRIILTARDRYGHTSQNIVEITYIPSNSTSSGAALRVVSPTVSSSTAASTPSSTAGNIATSTH